MADTWTLMFYFAGDNPLAPGMVSQLKSIKGAGFHPDINTLVQFDPNVPDTPTHTFDVGRVRKRVKQGKEIGECVRLQARRYILGHGKEGELVKSQ